MASKFFLTTVLLVVFSVQTANAIKCYVCNSGISYDGDECLNVKDHGDKYKNDCSANPDFKRCRIIVQDVEGEVRTVRSCATWPDTTKENRCVDRTGTSKIKLRYCECDDDDYCNGMSTLFPSIITIIIALAITFLH